jgi:hypothetical protein
MRTRLSDDSRTRCRGPAQPRRLDLTHLPCLYQDFSLRTIHGIYVVVPKGVPCFASSSLGEIARQISEYEYPQDDQPPGGPPANPR